MLAVLSPTASAECEAIPSKGLVCPADLPLTPEWGAAREVCEGGCFLLHPDDEREGRHAIERAKLIPQLVLNLDALTGDLRKTQVQRDKAREATKKATELWRIEVNRTAVLESKLADSFDLWDVILGGGIGAGAGAVLLLVLLVAL